MTLPLVEVKWMDACGTSGWKDATDIVDWMEDETTGLCWHTGYLFAESDDYLVLVAGHSGVSMIDAIKIPKSLIQERREVKYVEERN
jgi:hypothetical protein